MSLRTIYHTHDMMEQRCVYPVIVATYLSHTESFTYPKVGPLTEITSIQTHHNLRELYNTTFISDGCHPSDQYNPNTALDDTIGTYLTNYIIGIVGCLGVIVTYWRFNKHDNNKHDTSSAVVSSYHVKHHYYLMGYYALSSMGYSLAGVGHQLYNTINDNPRGHDAVFATLLFCVALGVVCAQFELIICARTTETMTNSSSNQKHDLNDVDIENNNDAITTTKRQCCNRNRYSYLIIAVLGIFIVTVLFSIVMGLSQRDLEPIWTIAGVYIFLGITAVSLVYLILYRDWGARLGGLVYATGFVVQVTLASRCGEDAYEDCFVECPLPVNFNHNALFHVLVVVGMLIQMMFGRYDGKRRSCI